MVCPHCTSMYVKKDGIKKNKSTKNQKFKCNSCSKSFSMPFESYIPDELEGATREQKQISDGEKE